MSGQNLYMRKLILPAYLKTRIRTIESKVRKMRLVCEGLDESGRMVELDSYDVTSSLPSFSSYTIEDYQEYTNEFIQSNTTDTIIQYLEYIIQLSGINQNQIIDCFSRLSHQIELTRQNLIEVANFTSGQVEARHQQEIEDLEYRICDLNLNMQNMIIQSNDLTANKIISEVSQVKDCVNDLTMKIKRIEDEKKSDDMKIHLNENQIQIQKKHRQLNKMKIPNEARIYERPIFEKLKYSGRIHIQPHSEMKFLRVESVDDQNDVSDGRILFEITFIDLNHVRHYIYVTTAQKMYRASEFNPKIAIGSSKMSYSTFDIVMRRGTAKLLFNVNDCATQLCMINLLYPTSEPGKYENELGSISRIKVSNAQTLASMIRYAFDTTEPDYIAILNGIVNQFKGLISSGYLNLLQHGSLQFNCGSSFSQIAMEGSVLPSKRIENALNQWRYVKDDLLRIDGLAECVQRIKIRIAKTDKSNHDLMFGSNHYSGTRHACELNNVRQDLFDFHECNVRVRTYGFNRYKRAKEYPTCGICWRYYLNSDDACRCFFYCLLFNRRGRDDPFCDGVDDKLNLFKNHCVEFPEIGSDHSSNKCENRFTISDDVIFLTKTINQR